MLCLTRLMLYTVEKYRKTSKLLLQDGRDEAGGDCGSQPDAGDVL